MRVCRICVVWASACIDIFSEEEGGGRGLKQGNTKGRDKRGKERGRGTNLLLQLKDAVHQRLARRRTPRDVDIHGHNPIATPRDTVAVMIIPAPVRAAAHADDPAGVGHLVVHLAEGGGHFVRQRAGDDHDVGLAGGGAEDYAQAVLIVAWGGEVHHFDGAAGEAEGHGPEGALAGPVGDLVHGCSVGWGRGWVSCVCFVLGDGFCIDVASEEGFGKR